MNPNFSISVVSHGHQAYIAALTEDFIRLGRDDIELILTLNLPEALPVDPSVLPFRLKVIRNTAPKGFAANHNAAFEASEGEYFVLLNPDIKLVGDPFEPILSLIRQHPDSICAPLIVNSDGTPEDSARNFPTPFILAKKLIGKLFKFSLKRDAIRTENDVLLPDWVAGMFIVVPRGLYAKLHGLDERYHLYYEDVDFCARARLAGCQVLVSPHAKAIHEAQRDSHRKLRYLLWHLRSALRFFTSPAYFRIQSARLLRS